MALPVSPRAKEKMLLRNDDLAPSSDEEDPYAPPDLVAPDPPTEEWFWSQFDLALWKMLPLAEKARRVAAMKADEKKREEEEAAKAARKVEEMELWREARWHAQEVDEGGCFNAKRARGASRLLAAWRWADRVEKAINEELTYALSTMARAEAYARREAADAHVVECEAEEVSSLRAGKPVRTRESVARRRERALMRDY